MTPHSSPHRLPPLRLARAVPFLYLLPCLALAAPVDLEPTVVSATTTERKLRDAPASVSLITAEDLRRRPVRDLQEALRGSESLQFNGVGMSRRGISVRGMSSEHTLVLVDGQRISTSSGPSPIPTSTSAGCRWRASSASRWYAGRCPRSTVRKPSAEW
ncbi:putative TonB-dependent receptor [Pseudomonas aeruginosa]|nr:putative TonB-dependent receptor [Pseudomonas aeruginosa]